MLETSPRRFARLAWGTFGACALAGCSVLADFSKLTGGAIDGGAEGGAPSDAIASIDDGALTEAAVGDGGSFAGPCDLTAPFGPHNPIPAPINDPSSNQYAGVLSNDGLSIYFCSDRSNPSANGGGGADLWVAHRATPTSAFDAPTPLDALNTSSVDCSPSISTDELSIYFGSDRPGGLGGRDLYVATRPDRSSTFGAPSLITQLSTAVDDDSPWIGAGGKALLFQSGSLATPAFQLFFSLEDGSGNFQARQAIGGIDMQADNETPMMTADSLTLYFGSSRATTGTKGGIDVFYTHRATTSQGFGAAVPVTELNSAKGDYPSWISQNGCVILVETYETGTATLYLAERGK